jgi:hypothetical protein
VNFQRIASGFSIDKAHITAFGEVFQVLLLVRQEQKTGKIIHWMSEDFVLADAKPGLL